MRISLTDAAEKLPDLVEYAEAGIEIILTRRGEPAVRLVAVDLDSTRPSATLEEKREALEAARQFGRSQPKPETSAARSQDFLYDEDGMPG